MRADSWSLRLTALDDPEARRRERETTARTLALSKSTTIRARRVAERIERMSTLYRERLEGTREPQR